MSTTSATRTDHAPPPAGRARGDDPGMPLFRVLLRQILAAVEGGAPTESAVAMIGVTSAVRGEGVTSAAVNLAHVAAATIRNGALLVDCHTGPSGMPQLLGAEPKLGLADLVHRGADPDRLLCDTSIAGLSLLSSGSKSLRDRLYDDACGLRETLGWLRALERMTILDLPAVTENDGMLEIVSVLDGLLLVVEAGRTPHGAVQMAQRQIARCDGRILGVVLNKAAPSSQHFAVSSRPDGQPGNHSVPMRV